MRKGMVTVPVKKIFIKIILLLIVLLPLAVSTQCDKSENENESENGNSQNPSSSTNPSEAPEFFQCGEIGNEEGIYVSPTGNDISGTGTIDSPFRTIGHALTVAESGDVIILREGTYPENVKVREPNITIKSLGGEWAHIQCPVDIDDDDHAICVEFHPDADNGKLKCLEISGGYYYGVSFETKWDWGTTDRTGATNMTIEDCMIHDTGRDSIKIKPGSDDVTIRRCEIFNSGGGPANSVHNAEGIDNVNGDRMLVQDSYIHDTATTGVYFKGGAIDCIVERTIIEDAGEGGIMIGFDTDPEYFDATVNPQYYEAINGIARNNIIINTGYAGIGLYASKDAKVYNNTIINAATIYPGGQSPIYFGVSLQGSDDTGLRPPNANPKIKNNIVLHSSSNQNPCVRIGYARDIDIWDYDVEPNVYIGTFDFSSLTGMPNMDYNDYFKEGSICKFTDSRPTSPLDEVNFFQWQSHISGDANSLQVDPKLDEDYHLSTGSPLIDQGTTFVDVTDDIDGDLREGPYDIGADEL